MWCDRYRHCLSWKNLGARAASLVSSALNSWTQSMCIYCVHCNVVPIMTQNGKYVYVVTTARSPTDRKETSRRHRPSSVYIFHSRLATQCIAVVELTRALSTADWTACRSTGINWLLLVVAQFPIGRDIESLATVLNAAALPASDNHLLLLFRWLDRYSAHHGHALLSSCAGVDAVRLLPMSQVPDTINRHVTCACVNAWWHKYAFHL